MHSPSRTTSGLLINQVRATAKGSATSEPRLRQHTEEEWQAMLPQIEQLYRIERRKLSEVMQIIEHKYAFKATDKMYKKRIRAWGLIKNKRHRKRADKSSQEKGTMKGGSTALDVAPEDATTGCSRIGREPDDYVVNRHNAVAMRLFGGLDEEEYYLSIVDWVGGLSQAGLHLQRDPFSASSRLYYDFALASALFRRNEGLLAGRVVRKAFLAAEDVVTGVDSAILRNLTDIFMDMRKWKQTSLLTMLRQHLASMAVYKLPAQHPLARVLQYLAKTDHDLFYILDRGRCCWFANMRDKMNINHRLVYDRWSWDSSVLAMETDVESDYQMLRDARQILAHTAPDTDIAPTSGFHTELLIVASQMKTTPWRAIPAGVIRRVQGCAEDPGTPAAPPHRQTRMYAEAYERKAAANEALKNGEWGRAEQNMRAIIRDSKDLYGEASPKILRELWSLEKLLRRAGEDGKAAEVAEEALRRVRMYLVGAP